MITRRSKGIVLLLLAWGVLAMVLNAQAGPQGSEKQDKQIALFERVIDHMLADSPNFLVTGRDNTQGTFIEGHGAVFTFKTSLNSRGWPGSRWSWHGDDDVQVIVIDKDDYEVLDDEAWRTREMKEQKRIYALGKEEIVEMVRDFGEMLTTLSDADYLEIRARLRGAAYFKENRLRKLTVKVQMADVRAYLNGETSESRFNDRIEIVES